MQNESSWFVILRLPFGVSYLMTKTVPVPVDASTGVALLSAQANTSAPVRPVQPRRLAVAVLIPVVTLVTRLAGDRHLDERVATGRWRRAPRP